MGGEVVKLPSRTSQKKPETEKGVGGWCHVEVELFLKLDPSERSTCLFPGRIYITGK